MDTRRCVTTHVGGRPWQDTTALHARAAKPRSIRDVQECADVLKKVVRQHFFYSHIQIKMGKFSFFDGLSNVKFRGFSDALGALGSGMGRLGRLNPLSSRFLQSTTEVASSGRKNLADFMKSKLGTSGTPSPGRQSTMTLSNAAQYSDEASEAFTRFDQANAPELLRDAYGKALDGDPKAFSAKLQELGVPPKTRKQINKLIESEPEPGFLKKNKFTVLLLTAGGVTGLVYGITNGISKQECLKQCKPETMHVQFEEDSDGGGGQTFDCDSPDNAGSDFCTTLQTDPEHDFVNGEGIPNEAKLSTGLVTLNGTRYRVKKQYYGKMEGTEEEENQQPVCFHIHSDTAMSAQETPQSGSPETPQSGSPETPQSGSPESQEEEEPWYSFLGPVADLFTSTTESLYDQLSDVERSLQNTVARARYGAPVNCGTFCEAECEKLHPTNPFAVAGEIIKDTTGVVADTAVGPFVEGLGFDTALMSNSLVWLIALVVLGPIILGILKLVLSIMSRKKK